VDAPQKEAEIKNYNSAAVTAYALGGALVATGVVLWVLNPGDEAWAKTHALTVVPCWSDGGPALGVGGRW